MKKLNSLSLALNSDQYHAGLMEICRQFEGDQADEYLSGLVEDMAKANESLFKVMHIEKVRRNVKQENRQLMEHLMAASRYISSFAYATDETVWVSASTLQQLFGSYYGKPFAWMKVDERVGAVSALLRDLSTPDMKRHIDNLPEMTGRVKDVQESLDALKVALHEVDKANGTAPVALPLMPLKREAAAKLEKLVDYLRAMSEKTPDAYGEHYAVVMQIINRLNARRRRKSLQIEVELEDDIVDETTGDSEVALGA